MPDESLSSARRLTTHLEELRRRLIITAIAWLCAFIACYSQAQTLFSFISEPVQQALPEGNHLVFIHATEPFFTYLKVSAIAGLLLSLPIVLWQIWAFVSPALYSGEKKVALPFVLVSCLCFGCGTYFGFTWVFPLVFNFLITFGIGGGEINAMLSMAGYLTMASRLLLAFGLVFELPTVVFFLARLGVVDHHWLSKKRKYALLVGFVLGAVLTPPDIFSQTAIALPFIVLYEVSIVVARLFGQKNEEESTE